VNWTSGRSWLAAVFRLVLGGLWLWAGIEKLQDPRAFAQAVRAYDVLPEWLVKAVGYGLPVLEVCLGVLLVLGVLTRIAAVVSGLLFVVFLVGIIQVAIRGIKISCGCFGGGGISTSTSYALDILRDVVLLALAVFLVLYPITRISIDEFLAREDYVEPPSAKRLRDPAGRRKYEAAVAAKHKEARSRGLYVTTGLSLVVVLVSLIGIGVQAGRAKITGDETAANASVQSGVTVGHNAPATMDVFEDFQCPVCNQFEQTTGATLATAISLGQVQVRYHLMSFLDGSSNGNRYSSRAANAAICAADVNTDVFKKFHDELYGKTGGADFQPAEGSSGKTDVQLTDLAAGAGITGDNLTTFSSCVTGETHKALVLAMTDNASKRGITGTPTILIGGKTQSDTSTAAISKAIAAAQAGKTATPNPTPTPPAVAPSTPAAASSGASGSASASPTKAPTAAKTPTPSATP
jgi:protein-disulfide isomerase